MNKKYLVELTKDERKRLRKLISAGAAPARMLDRARILLKADLGEHPEGRVLIDREIAGMLETSTATVQRVRERFCTQGLEAALQRSVPDRVYELWTDEPKRASSRLRARRRPVGGSAGACGSWRTKRSSSASSRASPTKR